MIYLQQKISLLLFGLCPEFLKVTVSWSWNRAKNSDFAQKILTLRKILRFARTN